MDKNISHFQSMIDQNPILFPMLQISERQDPFGQDHLGLNNYQPHQNQDPDNFFLSSPNPFRTQTKPSEKCQSEAEPENYWENQPESIKIQNFQEVYSSQTFFVEQKSSQVFYEQSSTESKDRQSDQQLYQRRKDNRKYKRKQNQAQNVEKLEAFLEQEEEYQPSIFKRQGTLKSIAQIIFQIIQKHNNQTFPEVAMRLVNHIRQKQRKKGKNFSENQEKNIKRRVYDGLNVLIAAGVADKSLNRVSINGKRKKRIYMNRLNCLKQRQENNKNLSNLKQSVKESEERLKQKRIALKQLEQRRENLRNFYKAQSQTHNFNKKTSKIISFPFVCISTQSISGCQIYQSSKNEKAWEKDNSLTFDTNREDDFVKVMFANEQISAIRIQGDVDFIERIGQLYGRSSKSISKLLK